MKFALCVILGLISFSFVCATVINVPADVATIQGGINSANNGDTVLVASGTYVENVDFNGKFILLTSVAGAEETIIDGNQNGCPVIFISGEDKDAILDGFTLTNGTGWYSASLDAYMGGGLTVRFYSSPTLRNLVVCGNSATGEGEGDPAGGGVSIGIESNPTLENIVISNNVSMWGGGLSIRESDPIFKHVDIYGNVATTTGGAAYIGVDSAPVFEKVNIYDNSAAYYGGGVFIHDHSTPFFNQVTVTQNVTTSGAGGMLLNHGSAPIIVNSIFWGNVPDQIMLNADSYYDPDNLTIAYSDIMGGKDGINSGFGYIDWLDGNIDSDPLFTDSGNNDFSLTDASPCIDAGTNEFVLDSKTIVDMSTDQYIGAAPDMGSWESLSTLAIDPRETPLPQSFGLHQNYPNPFNPSTMISYDLPGAGWVTLVIYDVLGREVNTLINAESSTGLHAFQWNARDLQGTPLDAGIYLYQLEFINAQGTEFREIKKFSLLK